MEGVWVYAEIFRGRLLHSVGVFSSFFRGGVREEEGVYTIA